MNRLRAACFGLAVCVCLAGCAAAPPPAGKREAAVVSPAPPAEERVAAPRPVEDRDLFLEGIALLSPPGGPDPAKARALFAVLILRYPQSRWRPAAESVIRLIDENRKVLGACLEDRLQAETFQAETTALIQENESLKRALRELQEKLQTETAALVRENEKLKTDLQRLKTLEIELEKRERMLR
ncbi:MAG: hypothetical protein ACYDAA_09355 [Syntrophales bacterium]